MSISAIEKEPARSIPQYELHARYHGPEDTALEGWQVPPRATPQFKVPNRVAALPVPPPAGADEGHGQAPEVVLEALYPRGNSHDRPGLDAALRQLLGQPEVVLDPAHNHHYVRLCVLQFSHDRGEIIG